MSLNAALRRGHKKFRLTTTKPSLEVAATSLTIIIGDNCTVKMSGLLKKSEQPGELIRKSPGLSVCLSAKKVAHTRLSSIGFRS